MVISTITRNNLDTPVQFDGFTKTLNLKNSLVGLNEIPHSHTGTRQKYNSKSHRRERLLFLGFRQISMRSQEKQIRALFVSFFSSMVGRYGSLNQKGLPPQLFKPMRDSCHSFLSCDPGQEKWTNEGWGQRSFKMAADGGSVVWVGEPLTTCQKRIAGSFKMAADGGSVFWVGEPLNKVRAQLEHRKKRLK